MLTAHELLGFMSPNLSAEILEHAYQADKELYKATLAAVAQARKVRPLFLQRQPRADRHVAMLATLARPAMEPAAAGLVRGWLVKKHTALLAAFLNAIGVPHTAAVLGLLLPAPLLRKERAPLAKPQDAPGNRSPPPLRLTGPSRKTPNPGPPKKTSGAAPFGMVTFGLAFTLTETEH